MAKERASAARGESAESKEKKLAKDKVKKAGKNKGEKHSKEKKDKKAAKNSGLPEESGLPLDDAEVKDADGVENTVSEDIIVNKRPVVEQAAEKATKKGKKVKKSSKQTRRDARNEAEEEAAGSLADEPNGKIIDTGTSLFTIDVKPTAVDLSAVPVAESDAEDDRAEEEEVKPDISFKDSSSTTPKEGLNRQARRRLQLMAQEKAAIQKKLGVEVGSTEPNAEVDAAVEAWTKKRDNASARRENKKASLLRNRRGKVLTGKALVQKEKEIRDKKNWEERKARKLALSG